MGTSNSDNPLTWEDHATNIQNDYSKESPAASSLPPEKPETLPETTRLLVGDFNRVSELAIVVIFDNGIGRGPKITMDR